MPKATHPGNINFATALKDARELAGYSQVECGREVGVSQAAFSDWESGKVEPPRAVVFALEELLGFPPGGLSQHLGFIPIDGQRGGPMRGKRKPVAKVEDVIRLDPTLAPRDREILLTTYQAMRKRPTRNTGKEMETSACVTGVERRAA